jgi:hypothetical protein
MEENNMANKQKLNRSINMGFRVSEEERDMIYKRMGQTKMSSLRAYMLKQAIDGRVITIDLTNVNECTRLLRNVGNIFNQIAKRTNETGNIYASDIEDMRTGFGEIWDRQELILKSIAKMLEVM